MATVPTAEATAIFRAPPDRYIPLGDDGAEVAYRRMGSGPDVLFVHGWPVSGATFRTLLPYLVEHVTCHIVDLPGAGSSRFNAGTHLSVRRHIEAVRHVVDALEVADVAVVGHDSGGLIARHALANDPRLRAMGLIDTEQVRGPSWRFRSFLAARHMPRFEQTFGWLVSRRRLRRSSLVLGGAFEDPALLDGDFDEFFLRPLSQKAEIRSAAVRLLKSFDEQLIRDLPALHRAIEVPVQLVWGARDPFFPVEWARDMVDTFANARLAVIEGAALFSHEERPAEVAEALLPVLTKQPLTVRPASA
jgi:pimeloyl-ACP methyl ester carboxylesterase